MNIYEKLQAVQSELHVGKDQYSDYGEYNYRSAEQILETAKPICIKYKVLLYLTDKVINLGDRYYIESTAHFIDLKPSEKTSFTEDGKPEYFEKLQVSASAREAKTKTKMDDAQVTGSASSYARKYALSGLFSIDDNKDPDTNEYQEQLRKAEKELEEERKNKKEQREDSDLDSQIYNCAMELKITRDKIPASFNKKYKGKDFDNATKEDKKQFIYDMKKAIDAKKQKS